jgi:hypothetical protein
MWAGTASISSKLRTAKMFLGNNVVKMTREYLNSLISAEEKSKDKTMIPTKCDKKT